MAGPALQEATPPPRRPYSPIRPVKSQVSGKAQAEMSLQATFSGKSHQMHRTLNAPSLYLGVVETDASSTYRDCVRERTLTHLLGHLPRSGSLGGDEVEGVEPGTRHLSCAIGITQWAAPVFASFCFSVFSSFGLRKEFFH